MFHSVLSKRTRAKRNEGSAGGTAEPCGVGITMVTGVTGTVDRVVGLEISADDYIGKPFDPRELLARI